MEVRIQTDGQDSRVWVDGVEVSTRVIAVFMRQERGERAAVRVELLDGEGNFPSNKVDGDNKPKGERFEPWAVYDGPGVDVPSTTKKGGEDGTKGTGEETNGAKDSGGEPGGKGAK